MRIERLHIRKSPGLPNGLAPIVLGPGMTIILGPNGSGKTSIVRSIRALLWPMTASSESNLECTWRHGDVGFESQLFAKQVRWDPALTVAIPHGAANLTRFGIKSLLASDDNADSELAQQVARELAGGLDLMAAGAEFSTKQRLAGNSSNATELKAATQKLRQANRAAEDLHDRERRLVELRETIEETRLAASQHASAKALRELVEAHDNVRMFEAELSAFAPGLELLVGDESEHVKVLSGKSAQKRTEVEAARNELARHETELAALTFAGTAPEPDELDAWSARVDELANQEQRSESLRETVAGTKDALDRARGQVFEAGEKTELTREMLDSLSEGLDDLRSASGKVVAAQKAVELWEGWSEGEENERLRDAIGGLRAWLRTPLATGGTSLPAWFRGALFVLGVVFLVLGALSFALNLSATLTALVLLLAGCALLGLGAVARNRGQAGASQVNPRDAARGTVEQTGLAPSAWEPEAVAKHLSELESRQASADQRASSKAMRDQARNEFDRAERQALKSEQALADQLRKAGVAADFSELTAVAQAQAIFRWREAELKFAEVSGQLSSVAATCSERLNVLDDWLTNFGDQVISDSAAARSVLRRLTARIQDLKTKTREAERTREGLALQTAIRDEAEQELAELWTRVGVAPGELAELSQRIADHEVWVEHRDSLRSAQQSLRDCEMRYARAGELPRLAEANETSATVKPERVDDWISELEQQSERKEALIQELGGIENELDSARSGHGLEDALAGKRVAAQGVAAVREQAVEDELARMLLEEARAQHTSEHSPPLLLRAQRYFGGFTHNGYKIELDEQGNFAIRNLALNRTCSLEELSDGTRVQLLLAARLAALEELEQSVTLPICLDEALATTDPVRFDEIARALFEVVASGRQLLYCTADPNEAEQWRQAAHKLNQPEPMLVDLAQSSGGAAAWGELLPGRPNVQDRVPAPAGKTHEEYARELNVPLPHGFDELASWHLYLITHNHLEALAECLRWQIQNVGTWHAARAEEKLPSAISAEVILDIDRYAGLAETLLIHWRIGRGRPVTWADVLASKAITETFEDRVRDVYRGTFSNPREFVNAVRAIKGIRTDKADKLEAFLEGEGYLPVEVPLEHTELIERCLRTSDAADELGPETVVDFLEWALGFLTDESRLILASGEAGEQA